MSQKALTNNDIIQGHILDLLNLEYLPDDQRLELLEKMSEVVNQRLLLRVLRELSGKRKDEFVKILDEGSDEQLQQCIDEYIPNFFDMLTEEVVKLKSEMVKKNNVKK